MSEDCPPCPPCKGEEKKKKGEEAQQLKVETVPWDPRYPQTNQTIACFRNYCDYYRCVDLLEDESKCELLKRMFTVICPHAWVEKWDEQREKGNFPDPIVRVPKDYCEKQEVERTQKAKRKPM